MLVTTHLKVLLPSTKSGVDYLLRHHRFGSATLNMTAQPPKKRQSLTDKLDRMLVDDNDEMFLLIEEVSLFCFEVTQGRF